MSFDEELSMSKKMDKKVDILMEQIRYKLPTTCVAELGCDEYEDDWRHNKGFHIYITEINEGAEIWHLRSLLEDMKKVCYLNDIDHIYVDFHDFNRFSMRCYFKDDSVSLSAEILNIANEMFVSDDEKIKRIKELIKEPKGDE